MVCSDGGDAVAEEDGALCCRRQFSHGVDEGLGFSLISTTANAVVQLVETDGSDLTVLDEVEGGDIASSTDRFVVNSLDIEGIGGKEIACLLYTSPSPRDATLSRMPSSA